jgi:ribonuclease J
VRACIHRGAKEIGGSCVELEHEGARLVLDVGRPLDAELDAPVPLPPVAGLADGDPSLVGLVISHGHPDHYGLVSQVHPSVPLVVGEATTAILTEAAFFSPSGMSFQPRHHLRDREPRKLGPFLVTPYLTDHSAFDAYSLLVEAGGRRLFYSGDLRAHGRKAALFERLLDQPPQPIHALLLEGTHIRTAASTPPPTTPSSEHEVEERAAELMEQTDGMVLACFSGQNLDRLVSFYRAARRSGRLLVLDLYGATLARATGRPQTIPQAAWDGVRVFVPRSQRVRVKQARAFELTDAVRAERLYPEQLASLRSQLVLCFRGSMMRELEQANCLDQAAAIWSLWSGYLDQPAGQRLRQWLDRLGIPLTQLHASGHAAVRDLQRLASALAPEQVVPIHTSAPERYPALFERVLLRDDGEWWPV